VAGQRHGTEREPAQQHVGRRRFKFATGARPATTYCGTRTTRAGLSLVMMAHN